MRASLSHLLPLPGPEEQRGLLEPGLRILLWTLRGALLLAMALGGWSCYCSGRRRGQVRAKGRGPDQRAQHRYWHGPAALSPVTRAHGRKPGAWGGRRLPAAASPLWGNWSEGPARALPTQRCR